MPPWARISPWHWKAACLACAASSPAPACRSVETRQDDDGIAVRIHRTRRPSPNRCRRSSWTKSRRRSASRTVNSTIARPVQFVSTGHGKLLVPIRSRERLRALKPDMARLAALGERVGSKGYFVFTLDVGEDDDAYSHGRMFAPAIGVDEDPVTGNANGPLGAYLVRHGLIAVDDGEARFRARQQAGNGRGGFVDVSVRVENGEPVAVAIEGRAVLGERVDM